MCDRPLQLVSSSELKYFPPLSSRVVMVLDDHTYCETFCCAVAEQLSAQHGAVKMLHSRVRLILDYLKDVQTGV